MRSIITFAAAAMAAATIVPRYAAQFNVGPNAPAAVAPHRATATASSAPASVDVARDDFGRFRVDGRVDGTRLEFTVDTGASVIALTADDAASLGIRPAPSQYSVLLRTANGAVRAAPVRLGMVEIGDITLHDVTAVVMPAGTLNDNLLGMSFLSRLRHFDYSAGHMVLEQ